MNKYILPEFLLSEVGIKDGTYNDHRIWITCPKYLSIVEFVCLDDVGAFASNQIEMSFEYEGEEWLGFFAQNNCEMVEADPKKVLKQAWKYYSTYLHWEDENSNISDIAGLN